MSKQRAETTRQHKFSYLKCEIQISGLIGAKDNRWVVKRSFSWFNWQRRLAKDYEKKAESHAEFCIIAFIANALHKLDKLSTSKKH